MSSIKNDFQTAVDYLDQKRRNLKARALGRVMEAGLDGDFEAAEKWRSVANFLRLEGDDKPNRTAQKKRMYNILDRAIRKTGKESYTPEELRAAVQDELDYLCDGETKADEIARYAESLPKNGLADLIEKHYRPEYREIMERDAETQAENEENARRLEERFAKWDAESREAPDPA